MNVSTPQQANCIENREIWKQFTYRLPFRIALTRIGMAEFRAIEPDAHPFDLPPHPNFDVLPLDDLKSGTEAIILTSHPIQKPLKRLSKQRGTLCYVPATYRHFYIDLKGTFQEYLEKFSSKTRNTLQRKVRKLMGDGGEFRVYRDAEEMMQFHPLAVQVSHKTWQENLLQTGLSNSPKFQAELRTRGEQDTVRAFLLFKGGNPIAYLYTPAEHGVLIYDRLGYDADFHQSSPGSVLQYLALEYLFAEKKFKMFDFWEGEGQHKETFATDCLECADVCIFAPTLRANLLIRAHLILDMSVRGALWIAERLRIRKLLKRVVKLWSAK